MQLPDPERVLRVPYPHQLSGGQRQRIRSSAIALILRPALLICDEPTTALDVTTQAEVLALIAGLQRENGTAVLFITHDFGVVAEIADRVVVMQSGQMVEQGDNLAVLQAPREDYTKMLLAAVPELGRRQRPSLPGGPALLDARAIGKTYVSGSWPARRREVRAADDVSLIVHPGETVGIVGESGSGKSTVARCIARLIEPTSGEIFAGGHSVARAQGRALSPFRRHVQVVFQDPYRSLNPRQTAGASIVEGPRNFGVPRDEAWARAEALMHLVRMQPSALQRYPSEFSGGQRHAHLDRARARLRAARADRRRGSVGARRVRAGADPRSARRHPAAALAIGIVFITHDLRVAPARSLRYRWITSCSRGASSWQGTIADVFSSRGTRTRRRCSRPLRAALRVRRARARSGGCRRSRAGFAHEPARILIAASCTRETPSRRRARTGRRSTAARRSRPSCAVPR